MNKFPVFKELYRTILKNKVFFGLLLLTIFIVTVSVTIENRTVTFSSNYQIDVIDNNTGGDITNNTDIYKYLPKSDLTNEIISKAKFGTVMVTIGNGSEPRVMLVAGTHGAEIPSQIAVMYLINNLVNKKINGTVYIVPFAIPNNTANNIRFNNGIDPNRIAEISGTPTNNIAEYAKKLNIKYFGDFHSTRPNDIPGENSILYYPNNPRSVKLSSYVSFITGSQLMKIYSYPGVLTTVTNNTGIGSVTFEVQSPHGIVKSGSLELSYRYMVTFLMYTKNIYI